MAPTAAAHRLRFRLLLAPRPMWLWGWKVALRISSTAASARLDLNFPSLVAVRLCIGSRLEINRVLPPKALPLGEQGFRFGGGERSWRTEDSARAGYGAPCSKSRRPADWQSVPT